MVAGELHSLVSQVAGRLQNCWSFAQFVRSTVDNKRKAGKHVRYMSVSVSMQKVQSLWLHDHNGQLQPL